MARRQDELVAAIQAQRRELRQEIDAFLALEPLKTQIRDHPGPWLLGGILAGALAARFLVAPLWKQRGNLARTWVRSRLKDAVLSLVTASVRATPGATVAPAEPSSSAPLGLAGLRAARLARRTLRREAADAAPRH